MMHVHQNKAIGRDDGLRCPARSQELSSLAPARGDGNNNCGRQQCFILAFIRLS